MLTQLSIKEAQTRIYEENLYDIGKIELKSWLPPISIHHRKVLSIRCLSLLVPNRAWHICTSFEFSLSKRFRSTIDLID